MFIRYTFFLTVLFCVLTGKGFSKEYTIMTENLSPLSYVKDGELKGLAVEIVNELLKKLDVKDEIHLYPWARAYLYIKNSKNHVLFSMARTPQREKLFKWVGPIITARSYFYKCRHSTLSIKNLDDAKKAKTILVPRDFPEHLILLKKGFKNLYLTTDNESSLKMLKGKRGELTTCLDFALKPTLERAGINPADIVRTKVELAPLSLYIAMSKDTPDYVVKRWQTQFEMIKKSDFYKKTLIKYLP